MRRIARSFLVPHRIVLAAAVLAIAMTTVVSQAKAEGHAFLYSDGLMTDLGTLSGTDSSAAAINDSV